MTADTITTARLRDLAAALQIATTSIYRLANSADIGEVTTAEAAAEVAEIMANLNAEAR